MSYSLHTKKRKFHRVLDSISNPSREPPQSQAQQSHTTTATTTSPLSTPKRPRLNPSSVNQTPSKTPIKNDNLPNYVPWSRPRFLERLRTFRRVDRWTPKPAAINEVAWAKRGWECVGVQTLGCVGGCGREVVVKLPEDVDIEEEKEKDGEDGEEDVEEEEDWGIKMMERREVLEKLCTEYQREMVQGHVERCPWRVKGCDDTIQHLPLSKPEVAISSLSQRYHGLCAPQFNLPDVSQITTPIDDAVIQEIIKILPEDFTRSSPSQLQPLAAEQAERDKENLVNGETAKNANSNNADSGEKGKEINIPALKLSLLGWEVDPDSPSLGLITCNACFRRLGLWMYTRKPAADKPSDNNQIDVEGREEEEDEEEESENSKLDAAREHQEYCPWINHITQSCDSNGKINNLSKINPARAGWEVLIQDIRVMHRRLLWSGPLSTTTQDQTPATPAENSGKENTAMDVDIEGTGEDEEERKQRDREWWRKIQRLRQVLKVKGLKREGAASTTTGVSSRASSVARDARGV